MPIACGAPKGNRFGDRIVIGSCIIIGLWRSVPRYRLAASRQEKFSEFTSVLRGACRFRNRPDRVSTSRVVRRQTLKVDARGWFGDLGRGDSAHHFTLTQSSVSVAAPVPEAVAASKSCTT
jgi:hypothetical protein